MAKELQYSYSGIFSKQASNNTDSDSIVDIVEGKEPGCSRDTILVAADSYDDIVTFISPAVNDGAEKNDVSDDDRLMRILRDDSTSNAATTDEGNTINDQLRGVVINSGEERIEQHFNAINCISHDLGTDRSRDEIVAEKAQDCASPTIVQHEDQMELPEKPTLLKSLSVESSGPDWQSEEWRHKKKHVFILSCAGKPIYTRYGDADQQASLFGTLLTLSQFLQHTQNVQSNKDLLKCVFAGRQRIVFVSSEHMVMVVVCHSSPNQLPEPTHSLVLQLTYVYNQIVSVLSVSRLKAVYEQRPNFDLRRLLSGAEMFIDSLLKAMDVDPAFLLCSVRCLPLENSLRETIAQTISSLAKIKDLVFAVMITGNQLIALVRMKQFLLHPVDLHILFNLVSTSESFKHAESWSPVCLPKFDPNGYLHCHISYLDDDSQVCLLLLSVNKDMFYVLSECRRKIREKLIKNHTLQAIKQSLASKMKDPGINEVLHFIYKARSTGQFIESDYVSPYHTEEERERLFSIYRYVFCLMHTPGRRLKIYYHMGDKETILGWITLGFELFAVFSPFTTKNAAIQLVNRLLKWIKKDENRFFILNSHTF